VIPGLPASPSTVVESWNYTHIDVEVDGATFIPIVGLFAGGATSSLSSFTVVFDDIRSCSSHRFNPECRAFWNGQRAKKVVSSPMSVSTYAAD
jgi:hypothetical protein